MLDYLFESASRATVLSEIANRTPKENIAMRSRPRIVARIKKRRRRSSSAATSPPLLHANAAQDNAMRTRTPSSHLSSTRCAMVSAANSPMNPGSQARSRRTVSTPSRYSRPTEACTASSKFPGMARYAHKSIIRCKGPLLLTFLRTRIQAVSPR